LIAYLIQGAALTRGRATLRGSRTHDDTAHRTGELCASNDEAVAFGIVARIAESLVSLSGTVSPLRQIGAEREKCNRRELRETFHPLAVFLPLRSA